MNTVIDMHPIFTTLDCLDGTLNMITTEGRV